MGLSLQTRNILMWEINKVANEKLAKSVRTVRPFVEEYVIGKKKMYSLQKDDL